MTPSVLLSNGNLPFGLRFRNIETSSGLPGGTVRSIYQDHSGLMWLGVEYEGLVSFDGEEYDIFSNDKNNDNSLSSNHINCIVSDSSNVLWVGTDHGLNRKQIGPFEYSSRRFDRYYASSEESWSIPGNEVIDLHYTDKKQLLVGTDKGLCVYLGNDQFRSIQLISDQDQPRIQVIHQTKTGRIFVGTDIGLFELSDELKKVNHWRFAHLRGGSLNVQCIAENSKGQLWVGGYGIYHFDIKNNTLVSVNDLLSENNRFVPVGVNRIVFDGMDRMWVGTISDGLHVFFQNSSLRFIPHSELVKGGFRGDQIRDIYHDSRGSVWVAAKSAGINVHDSRSESFNAIYPFGNPVNQSLSNNILALVQAANGDLYIGSRLRGMVKYDVDHGTYKHYLNSGKDNASLVDDRIECMLPLNNGDILIGTIHGLSVYHPQTDDFSKILFGATYSMARDNKGRIWFGTSQGLFFVDNINDKIRPFQVPGTDKLLDVHISTLHVSDDNHLWVGATADGLIEFDPDKNELINYADVSGESRLVAKNIRSVYEDERGLIWVGTKLNGLYKYDRGQGVFEHLPEQVIQGSVFDILDDSQGNIWLTTNSHVCKLNVNNYEIEKYGRAYGLEGITLSYKSNDGTLFYGGSNVLTYFNPNTIDQPFESSFISIKSIMEDGADLYESVDSENHEFAYGSHLSFSFFLVDYSLPNQNSFIYKLENVDRDWIAGGNRNQVSYANLSPGSYTFSVKGTNADGVWAQNKASLSFEILPPWWLTIWAKVLYFVSSILLLYVLFEILSFRTRKQHELELLQIEKDQSEKLTQHKLRFFTNISHEFRTPLTLLLASSTKVIAEVTHPNLKKHLGTIAKSTKTLLSLVDELMQFRTIEEGKFEFAPVPTKVYQFINDIFEEFTPIAVEKDLNYELIVEGNRPEGFLDRNIVTKVVRNLLSNAVKYTPNSGSIILKIGEAQMETGVSQDEKRTNLKLEVIDTGVGMSENDLIHIFDRFYRSEENLRGVEGSGIGLDLVKSLVELHQGKILVESVRNEGSKFVVYIPMEFEGMNLSMLSEPILDHELSYDHEEEVDHDSDKRDRVLVVEDDLEILVMLQEMLSEYYLVSLAKNGVEGLEKALGFPQPNLIISDVAMPEMNGLDFCRNLKGNFKTSHVPVILLTAKSAVSDELAGIEAGANAYVVKPFYPEVLMVKVKGLLKNQKLLKERFVKEMQLNPSEVDIPDPDKKLLTSCLAAIESRMDDQEFSVEDLAREVGMSRTQLFRKIKYLVDLSPSELIYSVRLKRAASLLRTENLSISEVSYMTGFSSPKSFSTTFKKYYKVSPSKFVDQAPAT